MLGNIFGWGIPGFGTRITNWSHHPIFLTLPTHPQVNFQGERCQRPISQCYSLGGMTALSCMLSTFAARLLGGLMHTFLSKRGRTNKLFSPSVAGAVTLVAELVQMTIPDALQLVKNIAAPMMVANTVGPAMFMRILLDKQAMLEKYTSAFSATSLKIAVSTEGILRQGVWVSLADPLTAAHAAFAISAVARLLALAEEFCIGHHSLIRVIDVHMLNIGVVIGNRHQHPRRLAKILFRCA